MSITNLYKNDALVFQRSRSGYNFDFGKCIERALISEKEHISFAHKIIINTISYNEKE